MGWGGCRKRNIILDINYEPSVMILFFIVENKADVEQGSKQDNKPPTDEIIPVYRRDCHEEVYCGSHAYPGQGVYLLKFDKSYSLWRSKTLYYRVYYSR
jgi:hypothetical protein